MAIANRIVFATDCAEMSIYSTEEEEEEEDYVLNRYVLQWKYDERRNDQWSKVNLYLEYT